MPALTLSNLLLYSAQAALLIGALALALSASRPSPAFRLAACRTVLLVLLLLPWCGLLRAPQAEPDAVAAEAAGVAQAIDALDVRAGRGLPWGRLAGSLLVAGVVLRLLWLGAGLVRLSRLARTLPQAGTSDEVAALQLELGTAARVHFGDDVAQPVTFGLRPATVLVPASLLAASLERRRAVLCHELLHVRRRDWAWVLVEEIVLALLWFHPAVWWLVGELQLAREQVVDRLTVAATGARRTYMDALFAAADAPSAPPLFAQFLRRRHLARRLVALAEEVAMSRARLALGTVVVVGTLGTSGAVALAAWPLAVVQAPAEDHVMRFQPSPVASRVEVEFPGDVSQELTGASLVLDAVVDANGAVTSVRLVSLTARNESTGASFSATDIHAVEKMLIAAGSMEMTGPPQTFGDGAAVTRDLEALAKAATAALRQWRFVRPQAAPAIARLTVAYDVTNGRATFGPVQPLSGFPGATLASAPPRPGPSEGVLKVGGAIAAPRKIFSVPPVYPQEAKDAKVQGVVILGLTVGADGSVHEAWVVQSIPILDEAALEAVRQWRYEPTLMNGVAVPLQMTVTMNFTLAS